MRALTDEDFSFHVHSDRREVRNSEDALSAQETRYAPLFRRVFFDKERPIGRNVPRENLLRR